MSNQPGENGAQGGEEGDGSNAFPRARERGEAEGAAVGRIGPWNVPTALEALERSMRDVERVRRALVERGEFSAIESACCSLNLGQARLLILILCRISLDQLSTPEDLNQAQRLGLTSARCLLTAERLDDLLASVAPQEAHHRGRASPGAADEYSPLDSRAESESPDTMSNQDGEEYDDQLVPEPLYEIEIDMDQRNGHRMEGEGEE